MIDVLIISWLNGEVVKDSLRVLKRESDLNVILVNVERDGPKGTVFLPENRGASVARNAGLALTTAPYVLLLDGDILYIKGSASRLSDIIGGLPDAACVGIHNVARWDGTRNREEADLMWPGCSEPRSDFPQAWTQYGLFRGDWLRTHPFVTEGPFGEAGNGYEDDWCYRQMLADGMKSYYVDGPLYFHDAHSGNRNLKAKGVSNRNAERRALYLERWGLDK